MMIGEAPGEVEDRTGYPFVGRAGKILNFIIQFSQKEFRYLLTNAVGCRPCDVSFVDDQNEADFYNGEELHQADYQISNWNRDPTKAELEHCQFHLHEMEKAYQPDGIVFLGRIAATYKTQKPSVLLKHPSWIDRLDYKLLPTRIEAKKLSLFIESLQNETNQ